MGVGVVVIRVGVICYVVWLLVKVEGLWGGEKWVGKGVMRGKGDGGVGGRGERGDGKE